MNSRERVLTTINHQEPDRVPVDLGGTIMSSIMAHALADLRRHLGIADKPPKVYEVYQMLGEVEADIIERLHVDVLPVEPPTQFFGLRRENYKPWKFWDGTAMLMPGQFAVEEDEKGDYIIHHEGDPAQPAEGHMPKEGYYFDTIPLPAIDPDNPPPLDDIRAEMVLHDEEIEWLLARAENLRKTTDKALLLGCWSKYGCGQIGNLPDFLMLMGINPDYVKDAMKVRTECSIANFERLWAALGDRIDIIGLSGADYGTQKAELLSPDWFDEQLKPYYTEQNTWLHENTSWKTWQHSCGSIPRLLPQLVETGLDIINPVQCSAAGMDARWLKDTFGKDLTFWGGGVDTQHTFPFGTAEEVRQEVRERLRIFAPGGGYVFNPIHNIQHGTPPENILAAFDTVHEEGVYQ